MGEWGREGTRVRKWEGKEGEGVVEGRSWGRRVGEDVKASDEET